MTTIPIPIAVAMMLTLLAVSNHQQLTETNSGKLFALVLYSYALSMVFIGLRWSLDTGALLPIAATLAILSTVLLYLAFRSLGHHPALSVQRDWPHLLPVALMALTPLLFPTWTDAVLVLIKLVYALLLIQLARHAPESLQLTRLDWMKNSEMALRGAAVFLVISVLIDIAIAMDFVFNHGQNAASMVGLANLGSVTIIGWAALQAGRGSVADDNPETDPQAEQPEFVKRPEHDGGPALLEQLNTLLIEDRLFTDSNLSLQKIARKAGLPARTISRTINAQTNQNVSQWVNQARVTAACELLQDKDISVTHAMTDAGFMTKSNFNREFKRATGKSPSEWRLNHT